MEKIRVLIVDDHSVVRQGLRVLLEAESDIVVVGEADTGRRGVQMARELQPAVIIMDIAMPELNGLEATRQIKKEAPKAEIVILSAYSDGDFVLQLTRAGVSGYLVKETAAADLVEAIREIRKGNAFFSPSISKCILNQCRDSFSGGTPAQKQTDCLTTREVEVLQLIAEGAPNKQIASDLCLSIKTVEKHRQHLMNKLNIHNIAGLTRFAASKGIIENRSDLSTQLAV